MGKFIEVVVEFLELAFGDVTDIGDRDVFVPTRPSVFDAWIVLAIERDGAYVLDNDLVAQFLDRTGRPSGAECRQGNQNREQPGQATHHDQ